MSELATTETPRRGIELHNMDDLARLSKMFADSGFFADAKSAAQCGIKILAGQELGFPSFASMTGIHIIQGKPAMGANLMAAAIKRSGKYDYRVKQMDDEGCTITFLQDGVEIGESSFTAADAKKAGTKNLDKYPRNMYFARAISNGVRWYCPDVFLGPVYTPEELHSVDAELPLGAREGEEQPSRSKAAQEATAPDEEASAASQPASDYVASRRIKDWHKAVQGSFLEDEHARHVFFADYADSDGLSEAAHKLDQAAWNDVMGVLHRVLESAGEAEKAEDPYPPELKENKIEFLGKQFARTMLPERDRLLFFSYLVAQNAGAITSNRQIGPAHYEAILEKLGVMSGDKFKPLPEKRLADLVFEFDEWLKSEEAAEGVLG